MKKSAKRSELYLGGEAIETGEVQARELKTFFLEFMRYLLHGKTKKQK